MKEDKQTEDKIPRKLLNFFLFFIKPYKWLVGIAVVTSLSSQLVDHFVLPYIIRDLIDKSTFDGADDVNIFKLISMGLVLYIAFSLLNSTLIVVSQLLSKRFQPEIIANINVRLLEHVHSHSYRYFSDNFGGSLANKISDLANMFFNIYNIVLFNFAPAVLLILVNVMFFTKMNLLLGALMLGWMIIHFIYLFSRLSIVRRVSKKHSEEISIVKGAIIDSLTNFAVVKLNSKQNFEKKSVSRAYDKEVTLHKSAWMESQKTWMPLGYFSELFGICMVVLMFYLYSESKITIGDLSYIIMVLGIIFKSVWSFNNSILNFISDVSKMDKALDTLLVPVEIEDVDKAKPLKVKDGNIKFDNISFHYNKGKYILKDFSLDIKAGEKVGLVGVSGAGKTTLMNLLIRLFDVQKGSVLIDGQDISKVKQKSLRENISVVTQDSTLFHRTLEENIGYTKEKATQKEIVSASKKADAHKFINELPKKYKTLVGERGIKLSGGQRQRVNIARTILKDAPILILDEATSALDSETEVYIQKTFEEIMKNKTTIAIAHRLSTLKLMDRIVVIDNGEIIEEGSHKELLSKNGIYAKLWKLQSTDFITDEKL